MTLGVPSAVSRMLAGLRSRWTMPLWWAAWTASASVATSAAAWRAGCGTPWICSARLPPSTNSIVKYGRPSTSPTS